MDEEGIARPQHPQPCDLKFPLQDLSRGAFHFPLPTFQPRDPLRIQGFSSLGAQQTIWPWELVDMGREEMWGVCRESDPLVCGGPVTACFTRPRGRPWLSL